MKRSIILCISAVVSVYGAEKGQEPQKDQKDQQVIIQKTAEQIAKSSDAKAWADTEKKEKEPSSPSMTPSEEKGQIIHPYVAVSPEPKDGGRPERYSSGNWKIS